MMFTKEVKKAAEILLSGKIILYPTDTIWGLGCDATNYNSVERIFEIKERKMSKSLIVLVDSLYMLQNYVEIVPKVAENLLQTTKNPLTIIYQKAKSIATNAIASDGSIAIRLPNDSFCKALINELGKPIISTSANISGEKYPSNYTEISCKIKNKVDYIVKYKQTQTHKAKVSTIILIDKTHKIKYLRK